MPKSELKACPFCGGAAHITRYHVKGWQIFCGYAHCQMDSIACTGFRTREEAVKVWNERFPEPVIQFDCKELHKTGMF